jgi:uncharacterized protein YndB with AHSA1/START domain
MSTTETVIQTTQIYQVFIRATPEQIWEAITRPEFTEKYFHGTRVDSTLEQGARYLLHMPDGATAVEGEVLEADRPKRLVHTWAAQYDPELAQEEPSRVTWEIEPGDGGVTKLTTTHDRLEASPKTAESVAGGWMYVLSGLKTLVETGEPLTS